MLEHFQRLTFFSNTSKITIEHKRSAKLPGAALANFSEVWLGAESNRRHVDFQSTALPTELPSRFARPALRLSRGSHYAAMCL